MKCLLCNTDAHRHACDTCIKQARQHLRWTELYTTWLTLPTMLQPTRGTTGRRQPGYSSQAPLRLEALVMLDHRSSTSPVPVNEDRGLGLDNDDAALWSILGTLHGLANYVRQTTDQSIPRRVTLVGEIGYLLAHIDWCAGFPWCDGVFTDIHQLHNQARALCHDRPESCGTCLKVDCEGQVFWMLTRDRSDKARCVACGKTYTGLDLVRLGVQKEIAG